MPIPALALLALGSAAQHPRSGDVARVPRTPPPASLELTSGGLVWSRPAGGSAALVALGDRGGQVLAVRSSDYRFELLSSFDSAPPVPVWISQPPLMFSPVAAAADTDVYLHPQLRFDIDTFSSVGELRMFRSRAGAAVWRFEFPRQMFSIPLYDLSRDGSVIVSCFTDELTGITELRVHDPATGQALQTHAHPVPNWSSRFDLSPDGAVAAFCHSDGASTDVMEIASGAHLASLPGTLFGDQAISDSGSAIATHEGSLALGYHVLVHARTLAGYQLILDVPSPPEVIPLDLAVSDDGAVLVASWTDRRTPLQGIVRAYDLATGAMTMEHLDSGSGQEVRPTSIAIDATGSRFVVGLQGLGSGGVSELAVYSPASSTPLRAHAAGGSVYDVDLSPDGKRYVAARASGNDGVSPVHVELYEFGGEDLVVRGAPSVGATIRFEMHASPGESAWLLRSFALAPSPIVMPGVGTLRLDPASLASTPIGTVPPSGVLVRATTATTVPGMIGRTVWYQGLTVHPRRLTQDFVQLTIVP